MHGVQRLMVGDLLITDRWPLITDLSSIGRLGPVSYGRYRPSTSGLLT